jgi:hypothetical protein
MAKYWEHYKWPQIQDACRNLFPPPRKPAGLNKDFIKWELFADAGGTTTIVKINSKPSGYIISYVIGNFTNRNQCVLDQIYDPIFLPHAEYPESDARWVHLKGNITEAADAYTFAIAPNQFNCADMTFYGFVN